MRLCAFGLALLASACVPIVAFADGYSAPGVGLVGSGHVIGNGTGLLTYGGDTPILNVMQQSGSGLNSGAANALVNALNASGGLATINGATVAGHCAQFSASGLQDTGSSCGGSGAGTVNTGTAGQLAYYASTGNGVSPETSATAAQGGTGLSAPTAHSLMLAEGTSAFNLIAAATAGNLIIDQGAGVDWASKPLTGDGSLAASGALTITKTNGVSFGTFATQNSASPPAIGGTTPNTGAFSGLTDTALSAAGVVTNTSGGVFGTAAYASGSQVQAGSSTTNPITPSALVAANAQQAITESAGSATVTWTSGFNARLALNANLTLLTLSSPSDGICYTLRIVQPASGGPYTVTWPASVDWGAPGAPTISTTANAIDLVTMCYDGTTTKYQSTIAKGF